MATKHRWWPIALAVCGIVVAAAVCRRYEISGYKTAYLYLLITALGAVAVAFHGRLPSPAALRLSARDLTAIAILAVITVPLYCWRVYTVPWQVSTDEVVSINLSRMLLHGGKVDVLGPTSYFGSPAATFVFFGRLGQLLGGIDLYHMRLVHAAFGVACVLLVYAFFRQFMTTIPAVTLAVIFGTSHSMIAFSRIGMWSSTALFIEVLALLLLARGIMRRSGSAAFLAGAVSGVGFYVYFPGRIVVALSLGVLAAVWLLRPTRRRFLALAGLGAACLVGWAMVTTPMLIATAKSPRPSLEYQRQQFLFYPEGQKKAEEWTHSKSPKSAWLANARKGLLTFNVRTNDQGWIYFNPGHGFLDPVSGVLLWLGLAVVLVRLVRRRPQILDELLHDIEPQRLLDLIAVVGFVTLYLSLAFLVTKAPNYQRLLIILPFTAYFAGIGLWWLADLTTARISLAGGRARPDLSTRVVILAVAGVVAFNVIIFRDYVSIGRRFGQDVGSTGRFVEARKDEIGHVWILAADKKYLYYYWGEPWWWQEWLGFFAGATQSVEVVSPRELSSLDVAGKFTVFMAQSAWSDFEQPFRERYRVVGVANVMPNGRLIAVEAMSAKQGARR